MMLGGPKALLQAGGLAMIENMAFHGFFATTAIVGGVASAGRAGAPRQRMLK